MLQGKIVVFEVRPRWLNSSKKQAIAPKVKQNTVEEEEEEEEEEETTTELFDTLPDMTHNGLISLQL
jgi:hypothetical protein